MLSSVRLPWGYPPLCSPSTRRTSRRSRAWTFRHRMLAEGISPAGTAADVGRSRRPPPPVPPAGTAAFGSSGCQPWGLLYLGSVALGKQDGVFHVETHALQV